MRASEFNCTSSVRCSSVMGMSAMVCSNCSSPMSEMLRSATAVRTSGVMMGLSAMALSMLAVMPNSRTAPMAATPMAWPTLRMVVWMPPDCGASRSLTARATMLLAWAETMPAPAPATARPTHMSPLTSEPCSEKAMGMKAQAITM